jgi:phospholipid/cholesterol/gamma-HCH transport system substrate-binding protein
VEERASRTELALGLLVAGVLVAFVWLAFAVGSGAPRNAVHYDLVFDSALGLSADNMVAVAGVRVGVVSNIRVDGRRARVSIAVEPGTQLHADATAAVRQKTLLGERYVDLDPGTTTASLLAPGQTLANTVPTKEIDEVIRQVAELVERLNRITPPLESALGRVDEALANESGTQLVSDVLATVQEARGLIRAANGVVLHSGDDLQAVLAMARGRGPAILDKLDAVGTRVNDLLAAVDPATIENATSRIGPAAENVNQITSDMRTAMVDVRSAAQRFDGVLLRLDQTLQRLDAINEGAIREMLQIQGVRVNFIPDTSVTTRVKKLREESVPLPLASPKQ